MDVCFPSGGTIKKKKNCFLLLRRRSQQKSTHFALVKEEKKKQELQASPLQSFVVVFLRCLLHVKCDALKSAITNTFKDECDE